MRPSTSSQAVPWWTDEQPPEVRVALDVSGPATGSTAAWVRSRFSTWLAVDLAAGELFDDLVLVVYEALANAADHAYPTAAAGPVTVHARRTRDAVYIAVADHGTWQVPRETDVAAPARRGRGLPLIRRLVNDLHIERGSTGTTVHLRAALPPPLSMATSSQPCRRTRR